MILIEDGYVYDGVADSTLYDEACSIFSSDSGPSCYTSVSLEVALSIQAQGYPPFLFRPFLLDFLRRGVVFVKRLARGLESSSSSSCFATRRVRSFVLD